MPFRISRIGPELDRCLQSSQPEQMLQVVLLLAHPESVAPVEPAARRKRRNETAARIKEATTDLLPAIDVVLMEHGGKRLNEIPTALGTIAVEATIAGVRALAELPGVEAILANQALEPPGHR